MVAPPPMDLGRPPSFLTSFASPPPQRHPAPSDLGRPPSSLASFASPPPLPLPAPEQAQHRAPRSDPEAAGGGDGGREAAALGGGGHRRRLEDHQALRQRRRLRDARHLRHPRASSECIGGERDCNFGSPLSSDAKWPCIVRFGEAKIELPPLLELVLGSTPYLIMICFSKIKIFRY